MYLEIDEGYFEHPKTLDLCSRLQDSKACVYPLRLWKWACRSAKSGKLGKISAFAMEKAVDYEPMDGRCFESMCLAGFVDAMPDGAFEIHDWMEYTGGALKRMEEKAAENRRRREEGKRRYEEEQAKQRTGIVPVQSENRTGTNPTQTRPDQTSQDQTSENPARARSNPPANDPGKPSTDSVMTMFSAIRARTCATKALFYQPSQPAKDKCAALLAGMDREAVADIEPAIQLACEHVRDGDEDWNDSRNKDPNFLWGTIAARWTALREELHGCAPKVARKPAADSKPALRVREI